MARIHLMSTEEMNELQRSQYDRFPSNLVKGLLTAGRVVEGYAALGTVLRYTKLPSRITEFVIIRVGALSGCEYELMQHRELAQQQGWTQDEVQAIIENNGIMFDEKMRAVLQFVNECVEQVKVSEAAFGQLERYLDHEEMTELTLLIGHYMLTARFLETFEIDLDESPTSWDKVRS